MARHPPSNYTLMYTLPLPTIHNYLWLGFPGLIYQAATLDLRRNHMYVNTNEGGAWITHYAYPSYYLGVM